MNALIEKALGRPSLYCTLQNAWFGLRGHAIRLRREGDLFELSAPGQPSSISLVSPIRHYKYSAGIKKRLDRLARIYFLEQVPLASGDVVIDCGANIGEIGMWLTARTPGLRYHAVEPGEAEARAIARNVPEAMVEPMALWNEDGEREFFLESGTADSSLIAPTEGSSSRPIATARLDTFLKQRGIEKVRLLKVEAEGGEPEVIEGLGAAVANVDYIAVDMGPERNGNENTVQQCVTMLAARGFELQGFHHARCTGLFARRDIGQA